MTGAQTSVSHLLALNSGSSSLKLALYACPPAGTRAAGDPEPVAVARLDGIGVKPRMALQDHRGATLLAHAFEGRPAPQDAQQALRAALDALAQAVPGLAPQAVGHRVVMGGARFADPVAIDAQTLDALDAMSPLAPLHQPACVAGIRAAMALYPAALQVACFDTAFHRSHPAINDRYALPGALYAAGVRRYGFHGLSYDYIARRMRALDPALAAGRMLVAHLGNGASMCALADGRSIDSTMGFSALDGLPMGTRCGQIDPGVLLWLMQARGMDADGIARLLYRESGLLALSGISSDMRELEASADPAAAEAIDYFVGRVCREAGALAAALQGIDGIVFTGGIGENSTRVRERTMRGCAWLGARLDTDANARAGDAARRGTATRISADGSPVAAWVVPTDEASTIARQTLAVRDGGAAPPR